MDVHRFNQLNQSRSAENKKFLNKLKRADTRRLDEAMHGMHEEVFAETDCLSCGNCCKTTSPIFYQADIERASRRTGLKPGEFIEKYLRIDEDNDYVLQSTPCPFLAPDNACVIYNDRPKACREYPHTNRKKIIQVLDLTYKNTMVCPAVLEIVERLKAVERRSPLFRKS